MSGGATILHQIALKRLERVEEQRQCVPQASLVSQCRALPPARDAVAMLRARPPLPHALIAEVKRKSPSKGDIAPGLDPAKLAADYQRGGAYAVSCLVEPDYFGGGLEDFDAVRRAVDLPLLYKDFVADPYQIWEARLHGADLVLLIVALLGKETDWYLGLVRAAGLQALVEVHDEAELEIAINARADFIGVNNRNLKTFETDLAVGERLISRIPPNVLAVAESGLHSPDDVERMARAGARAFLIGERFAAADDPAGEVARFAAGGAAP